MKKFRVNIAGIDIGYGYTKVCTGEVESVIPTCVARARITDTFGRKPNIVKAGGQSYVVGNDVGGLDDYSVGSDFMGSPEYLALLGYSLAMAAPQVDIAVLGLPPGIYNSNRIRMLRKALQNNPVFVNDNKIVIPEETVFIPQGMGIYCDYAYGGHPQSVDVLDANVVVIDIGHYTLDLILVEKGNYNDYAPRSYPLGISVLYDTIKRQFANIHNIYLDSDDKIIKLITEGKCEHFGNTYIMDTSQLLDEYINDRIVKTIRRYAGELVNKTLDAILVGGGGVNLIGKLLTNAIIVESPQRSNARGYYRHGCHLAETKERHIGDMPLAEMLSSAL